MPRKLFSCFWPPNHILGQLAHRADVPKCRRALAFMQDVANVLHLSVEKETFFLSNLQAALSQCLEQFALEFVMFHYGLRIKEFPLPLQVGGVPTRMSSM